MTDDALLLDLLNSTPVVDGVPQDLLVRDWLRERGGSGSVAEREATAAARALLQEVVRGRLPASALAPVLDGVCSVPAVGDDGISWTTEVERDRQLAVRAVLAWDEVRQTHPGRLRACENPDCALFLLDRSKPNRARWCSMASCGNRMKARRHYERSRAEG